MKLGHILPLPAALLVAALSPPQPPGYIAATHPDGNDEVLSKLQRRLTLLEDRLWQLEQRVQAFSARPQLPIPPLAIPPPAYRPKAPPGEPRKFGELDYWIMPLTATGQDRLPSAPLTPAPAASQSALP